MRTNIIPNLAHWIAIGWLLILWIQYRREPKPEIEADEPNLRTPKLITKRRVYY